MGEVRAQVTLTNFVDKELARRGQLSAEAVRTERVEAVVETGAVYCSVPSDLADRLGLRRMFQQLAELADGRCEEVDVTEPVLMEIEGRPVFEECLVLGDKMLIGHAALAKTDLQVDGRSCTVIPNPAHPEGAVVPVK